MLKSAIILNVDEAGFSISGGDTSPFILRESVTQAAAYKRDLYTIDQVCVALEYGELSGAVELNEHMENFSAFCTMLEARLPGATPWARWYLYVAFPAFDTRLLTIFRRNGQPDPVPEPSELSTTVEAEEPVPAWRRAARAADRILEVVFLPLDLFARGVQYVALSPVFLILWVGRRVAGRRTYASPPNEPKIVAGSHGKAVGQPSEHR